MKLMSICLLFLVFCFSCDDYDVTEISAELEKQALEGSEFCSVITFKSNLKSDSGRRVDIDRMTAEYVLFGEDEYDSDSILEIGKGGERFRYISLDEERVLTVSAENLIEKITYSSTPIPKYFNLSLNEIRVESAASGWTSNGKPVTPIVWGDRFDCGSAYFITLSNQLKEETEEEETPSEASVRAGESLTSSSNLGFIVDKFSLLTDKERNSKVNMGKIASVRAKALLNYIKDQSEEVSLDSAKLLISKKVLKSEISESNLREKFPKVKEILNSQELADEFYRSLTKMVNRK